MENVDALAMYEFTVESFVKKDRRRQLVMRLPVMARLALLSILQAACMENDKVCTKTFWARTDWDWDKGLNVSIIAYGKLIGICGQLP